MCAKTVNTYDPITHIFVPCSFPSLQEAVTSSLETPEIISDYYCSICKCKTKCRRTMNMHSYPNVLKIVINRYFIFVFTHGGAILLSVVSYVP